MEEFRDDDKAFQRWMTRHYRGYVVNCYRKPTPDYLVLHASGCSSLTRYENYTTKDYIKVCSEDLSELKAWARGLGGSLQPCGECNP